MSLPERLPDFAELPINPDFPPRSAWGVFGNDDQIGTQVMNSGGTQARELAAKMSEARIAFAPTGDPQHAGLPKWPAFTAAKGATMLFDNKCEVKNDPAGQERRTVPLA